MKTYYKHYIIFALLTIFLTGVIMAAVKRVEALEELRRSLELVPTKNTNVGTKYPEKKGIVTPGQLNFIKG
jgi:hypothetical protein